MDCYALRHALRTCGRAKKKREKETETETENNSNSDDTFLFTLCAILIPVPSKAGNPRTLDAAMSMAGSQYTCVVAVVVVCFFGLTLR